MSRSSTIIGITILGLLGLGSVAGVIGFSKYQEVREQRAARGPSNPRRELLIGEWGLAPPSGRSWTPSTPIQLKFNEDWEGAGSVFSYGVNGDALANETFQQTAVRFVRKVERGESLGGSVSATCCSGFTFIDDTHITIGSNAYEVIASGDRLITKDGNGSVEWVRMPTVSGSAP